MTIRDGPFGAGIPLDVELSSTEDDEFEGDLAHAVGLRFPGMEIRMNAAIPTSAGRYIRPDLLVLAPGTAKIFLVADAKRRQEIRRRDVKTVARYRVITGAEKAAIFHPASARIGRTAVATARQLGVQLQPAP